MPSVENLPLEQRIKRYRAEIEYHQNKPGYAGQFMFNLYTSLLVAAQGEIRRRKQTS